MKKFYALLVKRDDTFAVEKALNVYRIGLNDWDKTRVLYRDGVGYVSYTIICTAEQYESIKSAVRK